MSLSLSDDLTIILCVLGVIFFILFLLMIFLCFECLRQRDNTQLDDPAPAKFSLSSFISQQINRDPERGRGDQKEKEEQQLPSETFVLKDTLKTSYVSPQSRAVQTVTPDSDTESHFSYTSESFHRAPVARFCAPDASSCGTIVVSIKFYHFAKRLAVRVGEVELSLTEGVVVNPYVKLHLLPEYRRGNRQTTRVKRNTTQYVCDEDFLFGVGSREVGARSLSLQVYDYKSNTRHLCIGRVSVPLEEYNFKDEDKPLSLKQHIIPARETQDSFGSLQVALTVTTESIRLAILRAEGLIPVDMHGSIEPYCRVLVYNGSEMVHKKKTCIAVERTFVWQECFTLDLPEKTLLCDVSVTIEVRDALRNTRSTSYLLLGRVILSNSVTSGHGLVQWEHACSKRGTTVTEWQPIQP